MDAINLNHIHSNIIVRLLKNHNILSIHSNPGLRNAPLLHALAADEAFHLTHHFDERATAYRALAEVKITQKPCALLCTSGTALANYFPAVIEAYFQDLPLIVISSDRPEKATQTLSNQCIYQNHLFGKYTENFCYAKEPYLAEDLKLWTNQLIQFFDNSLLTKGPSHLNISFLDPAKTQENSCDVAQATTLLAQFENIDQLIEQPPNSTKDLDDSTHELQLSEIQDIDLISIGEIPLGFDPLIMGQLKQFLKDAQVPIAIDITSGMKYELLNLAGAIPSLDHPEVYQAIESLPIKKVLHFGGRMTSKRYYNLLNELGCQVINLRTSKFKFNPADVDLKGRPFNQKNMQTCLQANFKLRPLPPLQEIIQAKREAIEKAPLSFPYISKWIIEEFINENDIFVLGNSTCIRSFDFYFDERPRTNPTIYTHRGASGIEGMIAILQGLSESAVKTHKRVVAVLGDISTLHDFNSFFLLKQNILQGLPIHLFIINDFGGGIFRLLNVPEMKNCKEQMETPHNNELRPLLTTLFATSENVVINQIKEKEQLNSIVNSASLVNNRLTINEILLNQTENNKVYQCLKTIRSQIKS